MDGRHTKYFVSYAREDGDFAREIAQRLRAAGVDLWLDQSDIVLGQRWDSAIQTGLRSCQGVIVILSPQSVQSDNVLDEISYAMAHKKAILPVLYQHCEIPVRLVRLQHADFTSSFEKGLSQVLNALIGRQSTASTATPRDAVHYNAVSDAEERAGRATHSNVTAAQSRRLLVALLAAVLFINYADRGLLSIAAPLIQSELHLDYRQLGLLFSAFFWTYAVVQIPVGGIAERYGAERVLAGGLVVWAAATLLVGVAAGFASLVALRMLLGLGESTGFPCVAKLLAAAVPVRELGIANGIVGSAYSFGPAAGSLLGGMLMARFGWRSAFFAFGAISLLWLWPWLRLDHRRQSAAPVRRDSSSPTFGLLLRTRALWGTALGLFCANYVFFFMMSWLPLYLVRERGFSTAQMASLTGASYAVMGVCALLGGAGIDRYVKAGGSPNTGYKATLILVHSGAVLCMLAMAFGPAPLAIGSIFLYQGLNGASAASLYAVPEILGGPQATGRWVGIQNSAGSLAGVAAPWLTGVIIQSTGHFTMAFILAAAVSLLGLVGWTALLPKLETIDWSAAAVSRAAAEGSAE